MRTIFLSCLMAALGWSHALAANTNGFAAKFTAADGKSSDVEVLPNLWLYVEGNKPPTPFLAPGKFTTVFEGFLNAELRGNHIFKAEELRGSLKLEINGATVLEASAPGALTKEVQLNKGLNAVRATFTAPATGDAALRVGWTEKGTNVNPIPNAWISHIKSPEVVKADKLRLGRELFLEHRCARCHTDKFSSPLPELSMDAPALEGIGARRGQEWLANWILDPKNMRALVHMPKVLHGEKASEDARAIAAYLASLKDEPAVSPPKAGSVFGYNAKAFKEIESRSGATAKATTADPEATPVDSAHEKKPIFERLHCTACHNAPDGTEVDAAKISLKHVAAKFGSEKSLAAFLKAPERHYAWIRMPNFKLADVEANELAAHLMKHADKAETKAPSTDAALLKRGEQLVRTTGCLNCHSAGKLENQFVAAALPKLAKEAKGCLAEKRDEKSKAPDFGLKPGEREALVEFVKTDYASLQRHSPMEFAARETRLARCTDCHGHIDLVPGFDVLGGKLRPEWAAEFIGGVPFKVRADIHPKGEPWTDARMPAFKSRAKLIAEGMAMQQGYAPRTPAEPPIDEEAVKVGLKLTGKDNGLSCISCHAVNDLPALEVFESEGINLGLTGARLLKPYFFRWMRNPLAIDPQTKMPAFFGDDGKSPLTDYYEGDAEKQINALYEYMRAGEKMAAPATGQ
jgi:mono/diheme cytochrome c family protein